MRLFFALLVLTYGPSAFAAGDVPSNIFNAELTDKKLSVAVRSFENTCMPFILHKTELTQVKNKAHMRREMTNLGYQFVSNKTSNKRVLVEPARPNSQICEPVSPGSHYYRWKKNTVSTFGPFTSTRDVHYHAPGEIYGPVQIPAKYRTRIVDLETYKAPKQSSLEAKLGWNYPSQNHPGKTCEIQMSDMAMDEAEFIRDFIEKDEDWKFENETWSQCIEQDDDDQFLFVVKRKEDALSIHVTRSDFYETNICQRQ